MKSLSVSAMVIAAAGILVSASACGSNAGGSDDGGVVPPCTTGTDLDGDRYGVGCPAGDDCDDSDPAVNTECPDANCGAGIFQGCACDPSTDNVVSCYDGPSGTSGNAPCIKGMRSCDPTTSTWSACGGQILPELEICDEADNDCDGEVDEAVQSACGNCIPGCDSTSVGTDPFPIPPMDPDIGADGVGLDPNGDLVLDSSTIENHFLWIANDPEGTVSKIDTRTGREVARYASVTHAPAAFIVGPNATNAVPAWNAAGAAGNRPSRTAIDFKSDAWVANRAHGSGGLQASVTKFGNVKADCVDRNGNGTIETSSDVDGSGAIEIGNPAEFLAEADECIIFTVAVGRPGSIARALAIDAGVDPGDPGDAWVGMYGSSTGEKAFYEVNGRTGVVSQRVPATGDLTGNSYGAAIDSQGRLWAPHGCCGSTVALTQINTFENPATFVDTKVIGGVDGTYTAGTYGITVDARDRIWIGGWTAGRLKRYDPATNTVTDAVLSIASARIRGVGIDAQGNVWAAVDQPIGRVVRVDADTAMETGVWDIGGILPIGVGVDFDGDVWAINQSSSTASRLHIDPITLQPAPHPVTGNQLDQFATGPNPYTYSDFTGLGLRTVTRPTGDYTVPLKGCAGTDEAVWLGIEWDATLPANTKVEIWAQSGNDKATLAQQPIYGPWVTSPADFRVAPGPVPDAQWLLLTIRLISEDGEATPIVHSYSVQWACPGEPVN